MIDSKAIVWGAGQRIPDSRVARSRYRGNVVMNDQPGGLWLDFDELSERLGCSDGEVREISYAAGKKRFGHWQVGHIDLMYGESSGRLELRCSLPKLLLDRNDELLTESGVHEALRVLAQVGSELTGVELDLADATPTRADLCYQWPVHSVAETLQWIKAGHKPARRRRHEIVSPRGGNSLVYGYGTKSLRRFYDKVGEMIEKGEDSDLDRDTLLRFEIQERRRPVLRLLHENGYRARDVVEHLQSALDDYSTLIAGSVVEYLRRAAAEGKRPRAVLGDLYLAQNDHLLPALRELYSESTYYDLRRRAKKAAVVVSPWIPVVPDDAFDDAVSGLWDGEIAA